jgi:hypothetical protein
MSKLPSRKPAKLSEPICRELSFYSLAAGAAGVSVLALASPSDAQIVYTPARETIGANHKIVIDFNHDGIADLIIREVPGTFGERSNSLSAAPPAPGDGIESTIAVGWAGELKRGARIGPTASFANAPVLMANYSYFGVYGFGDWLYADGFARYIGVRFVINGATHYGWARMNVRYNRLDRDIAGLLTGYAYQSKPNMPILAGATGGGTADVESGPSEILSTPKPSATLGALALGAGGREIQRPQP